MVRPRPRTQGTGILTVHVMQRVGSWRDVGKLGSRGWLGLAIRLRLGRFRRKSAV